MGLAFSAMLDKHAFFDKYEITNKDIDKKKLETLMLIEMEKGKLNIFYNKYQHLIGRPSNIKLKNV